LVSPVPVRFARDMGADFVIAVNISAQPDVQQASSSLDVLLQTLAQTVVCRVLSSTIRAC